MADEHRTRSTFLDSAWKIARDSIRDEDNLINHRMSWVMTSNAFLFSAFFLVFSHSPSEPSNTAQLADTYILFIPIIGITLCLVLWKLVLAATTQVIQIKEWWDKLLRHFGETVKDDYPPLVGKPDRMLADWKNIYSILPFILAMVWMLLFFVSIASLSMDQFQQVVLRYGLLITICFALLLYLSYLRSKKI